MSKLMNLGEYYDECAAHDWWHEMSDDNSVFERGAARHRRLESISRQSPEHKKVWHQTMLYFKHNEGACPERPTS